MALFGRKMAIYRPFSRLLIGPLTLNSAISPGSGLEVFPDMRPSFFSNVPD